MLSKTQRLLEGVSRWCSYYRSNPHRFAHDYLHLNLKLFQKILLNMMNTTTVTVFIGSRGIGKSFLSAIFCVTRCILYPGTKICIASGTRGQAINVLEKINLELKPNSRELALEIDEKQSKINGTNAQIVFKNGSYIKVVTASESSRGNRANILLLDEFRLICKDVIDTILRKFLTQRRMPKYSQLSAADKEREYSKEKNMTMYLSSGYWQDHWSYLKCKDTCRMMLDDSKHQFICGFPYHLSIAEGLLDSELVEDEMSETDFSEVKFSMEYGAEFYGSSDDAFFDFNSISKNRKIKYPMMPANIASRLNSAPAVKIIPKKNGEKRILSADIALMSSKRHKNDATSLFINSMIPTKAGRYSHNMIYVDGCEGLKTEAQALKIRKMYDEFECDYIVLDTNGIGLGVYDCLSREMLDPDTGQVYPALSCVNDKAMAERCTVIGAEKVIWSVKASAAFNSDCAFMLREGFRSGRIRLLENEFDAEQSLSEIKGFNQLSPADKTLFMLPYIHTTLLTDELVNLQHEELNGKIKIYEKANMRKDRYSSISYNFYVSSLIESKLTKKHNQSNLEDTFIIKAPKTLVHKKESGDYGKKEKHRRHWC